MSARRLGTSCVTIGLRTVGVLTIGLLAVGSRSIGVANAAPVELRVTVDDPAQLDAILAKLSTIDGIHVHREAALTSPPPAVYDRAVEPKPAPETIAIVDVSYDAAGRGRLVDERGHIWRETVPSPAHLRLKGQRRYTATLSRGTLGGWRLVVDGLVRELKVELLR